MEKSFHKEVEIPVENVKLKGELIIPIRSEAIIIFSHGSGSSRFSQRNRAVAKYLHDKNFGTLLFDLLTAEEDQHYYNRFNINMLAERLIAVTSWLRNLPVAENIRIGYFGASTGAASALQAAIVSKIGAIVSRGGRPDLVMDVLESIETPTLLVVGSLDTDVVSLNKLAYGKLHCTKEFVTVEGATHLFEEYGAMDEVCELAANWFEKYLINVPEAL